MRSYTRLTLAEREEISRELAAGSRLRAIARQLGRAPSTIGRELHRAERTRSTYRATRGQHVARRHAQRPRKLATHPALQAAVHAQLAQCWSPEQTCQAIEECYPVVVSLDRGPGEGWRTWELVDTRMRRTGVARRKISASCSSIR